jgi:SNF2 family DNA or RNA helicase
MMWFDTSSASLLYQTPNPLAIAQLCPDARQLQDGRVVVPASLANLQRLRRIDLPIIRPLDYWYDYPRNRNIIAQPFEAQRITANFLATTPRGFVLSDMGTGKTMASLWAADYVMGQHPPGTFRALIIAPLSTLRRVWADEIFNHFAGRRTAVVVHGDAKKRQELLAQPADFYIINHDGLKVGLPKHKKEEWTKLAKDLRDRADIRMVIVDECSAFRESRSDRSRAARQIITPRDYVWMMSGTPTPNGPLDAYGLAKLMNGAYGQSYNAYRQEVMTQVSTFKWVPRVGAHQVVQKLLSPAVRFAIEDCVDLPEMVVQARDAEMSSEQAAAYKEFKKEMVVAVKSQQITAANEGAARMKLIQIACGAVYDHEHNSHFLDCEPRIAVLREAIEQATRKVIVFAPLTSVLEMLKIKLSKDYTCEVVNGAVSDKKRSEIFRRFSQESDPHVLLADPGTMAHGLTLVAATTVVWYAPTDKTELYLQANKRIHRPGQVHTTSVVQISSSPIEREIYRRLASNESMQGVVLKLMEAL